MSKGSSKVTFVLFTYNEEQRIERAIQNFIPFGPVLVVDNESEDQTRQIALRHGCEVLIHKNAGWVEDEITTARVKSAVGTPWIYWGFADEMVDAKTIRAILSEIDSGRCDIVNIARKNYYYGEFCHELFADRMNRIFKKDAIDFTGNKIHCFGKVVPGSRIHRLPAAFFGSRCCSPLWSRSTRRGCARRATACWTGSGFLRQTRRCCSWARPRPISYL